MTNRDKNIVGEVLAKTYRIERFLGVGTIGTVYVARHVRSNGLYAVKVLHRKLAASPELYQRFQDEARLIATLRHPHIAPITDFDRDENGTPFFVMDLLEGENLQQRLKHKESLPLAQALEILQQVGSALSTAHRSGIVHRNIKPENIYLVRHDLGDRVTESARITDFGLSRFRRVAPAGTLDAAHGVSPYMAPELLQETTAPVDGRADQWALAVIGYRMLSGKLPFDDSSPEELLRHILNDPPRPLNRLMPELPSHMVTALNRGMAKRREDRYETMMDFVRAVTTKSTGAAPAIPSPPGEVEAAAPQAKAASPSGRVAAAAPPLPSGRVVAAAPPPPSGRVVAVAPPVPSAPVNRPPPSPAVPPTPPASQPAAPPGPATPSPAPAVSIPRAVPIPPAPASAASPKASAATPAPPHLAAPPLLLLESSPAPVVEAAKGPSWGLILGGAAVAVLAGLGLTLLLDSRQPHPQLPIPPAEEIGSARVTPSTPVVEALDLGDSPPPPSADAAARPLTPIAPQVPLPPLRALAGPESLPGAPALPTTPPVGEPVKPAGTPGTPGAPEAPASTPSTVVKPSATPPATVAKPPASSLPRSPATAPGSGTGESPTGSSTPPGSADSASTGRPPTPAASKPVPEPTGTPSATAPSEPKDRNTDDLMKEAQAAYVRGERGRATELALQVAEGGGPDAERAWRFIGSAACSVRNALMANKAYTKLESGEHKQMLQELCQRNGLSFQNGSFGAAPNPGSSGSSGSGSPAPE